MKDNCKPVYLDSGIDIGDMQGRVEIMLVDAQTGTTETVTEEETDGR